MDECPKCGEQKYDRLLYTKDGRVCRVCGHSPTHPDSQAFSRLSKRKALQRFEDAVRSHEMRGSNDPMVAQLIDEEYYAAKGELVILLGV